MMTDFSKDIQGSLRYKKINYFRLPEKWRKMRMCSNRKYEHRTVSPVLSHENTLRLWHCYCKTRGKVDALQPQ